MVPTWATHHIIFHCNTLERVFGKLLVELSVKRFPMIVLHLAGKSTDENVEIRSVNQSRNLRTKEKSLLYTLEQGQYTVSNFFCFFLFFTEHCVNSNAFTN